MIICNTLFSSCASIYSTLPARQRHLHLFQADPCRRSSPIRSRGTRRVVPSTFMSTLWLRHTPRDPPGPQSSNYIHSALRLSGSRGSNSVHLSLRTGCDSSDRTSCVFLFLPLSRSSPFASSRLCLARQAPVPAFGNREVALCVLLSFCLVFDIRSSSSVRPAMTTGWKWYLGISACILSAGRVIRTRGEGLSSSITALQVWFNCSTIVVASYVTSVLRGRVFSYFSFFFLFVQLHTSL